jgi:siroheme synthase
VDFQKTYVNPIVIANTLSYNDHDPAVVRIQNVDTTYMGVSTAGLIATRLLGAGWKPATPVIAVENASRDNERRVATAIAELAADPSRLGLNSPAILIFGEVAGLPAAGLVEDVLSLAAVRRAYA